MENSGSTKGCRWEGKENGLSRQHVIRQRRNEMRRMMENREYYNFQNNIMEGRKRYELA